MDADQGPADDITPVSEAQPRTLPATVWSKSTYWLLGFTVLFAIVLSDVTHSLKSQFLLGGMIAAGILLGLAIFKDGQFTQPNSGWPKYGGHLYVLFAFVPGVNIITTTFYLVSRQEIQHHGYAILDLDRLRAIWHHPRQTLYTIYAGAGILISALIPLALVHGYADDFLYQRVPFLETIASIVIVCILIVLLAIHRYCSRETRKNFDYALRDLSVRLLPILGVTYLAIMFMIAMILPASIVVGIGEVFFGTRVGDSLTFGIVYPMVLVPLAVLLVLPIRALPWILAAPYAIKQAIVKFIQLMRDFVESTLGIRNTITGKSVLPVGGHGQTDFDFVESAHTEMAGFYGYLPKPIDEIEPDLLSSSPRQGIVYLIPGYMYAVIAFTYYHLYPEQALRYASLLPGEYVVVNSISYLGIPDTILAQFLSLAGLSPEVLSLGFVGLIVPAAFMIPGAWHLALEYEGYLYRIHSRLGDGNHLLPLWTIHLIPVAPIVIGYVWYTNRGAFFRED